jgi:hypothetical protein
MTDSITNLTFWLTRRKRLFMDSLLAIVGGDDEGGHFASLFAGCDGD